MAQRLAAGDAELADEPAGRRRLGELHRVGEQRVAIREQHRRFQVRLDVLERVALGVQTQIEHQIGEEVFVNQAPIDAPENAPVHPLPPPENRRL